jgi:hypothetical protein
LQVQTPMRSNGVVVAQVLDQHPVRLAIIGGRSAGRIRVNRRLEISFAIRVSSPERSSVHSGLAGGDPDDDEW